MRVSLKGGRLVTAHSQVTADILCVDGKVHSITESSGTRDLDKVIDARGCLVFAGFIDPHVHSRDPGMTDREDFAHCTQGAAAGGVTTIFDMPNSVPPVTDAATFNQRAGTHKAAAWVDFGLWGMYPGADQLDKVPEMISAGVIGIKLFWAYALTRDTRQLIYNLSEMPSDQLIRPPELRDVYDLFTRVAQAGGLLAAHCEDRGVIEASEAALGHEIETYSDLLAARPDVAETAQVATAVEFSRGTGGRFHVLHMASGRSADLVRKAQADGIQITAETCPQYLILTNQDCGGMGPKVYPPIRQAVDRDALWAAVKDGTVSSVSSDHAPQTVASKQQKLALQPAGMIGVETLGSLMIDQALRGRVSLERIAWVLAEGTARLYGVFPKKGTIQPGSDADFTIVDPDAEWRVDQGHLHSKMKLSPWHDRELKGAVRTVVLRGTIIGHEHEPIGDSTGQLVRPARIEALKPQ